MTTKKLATMYAELKYMTMLDKEIDLHGKVADSRNFGDS